MIQKFVCPGCCRGQEDKLKCFDNDSLGCQNHSCGTMTFSGSFALGLPKGFNKCGFEGTGGIRKRSLNTMQIWCYPEGWKKEELPWEGSELDKKLNIPVWAMEEDGFLFVRCFMPRLNHGIVVIVEDGTMKLAPGALNVKDFIEHID